MQLKKSKGKNATLTIDKETQTKIKRFKDRLKEMSDNDEVSDIHKHIIDLIFNKLDTYDLNILIAYYDHDGKASDVARLLGVNPSVIYSRIKQIIKKCKYSI